MEKFGLGKKWFWIGIVCGFHIGFGLIYGISLAFEKKFRKEAIIIIAWTITWFILTSIWLIPFLRTKGLLTTPVYQSSAQQGLESLKPGDIIPTLPQ